MSIYNRIEQIINEKNLTFAQIERELGFGNGSLKRWNKSIPSVDKVEKLANYLNVSFSWLATGQENNFQLTEAEQEILNKFKNLTPAEQREAVGYINCLLAHSNNSSPSASPKPSP